MANPDSRSPDSRHVIAGDPFPTAERFAAATGARVGFKPPHPKEWESFWLEICERKQFRTEFPDLGLAEARTLWLAIEQEFFAKYEFFLRVWPDYASSGIWLIPYPGSRYAGPNLSNYDDLGLSADLQDRFTRWQDDYWQAEPWSEKDAFDYEAHHQVAMQLAKDLKREVGESIYVECEELLEVLIDGTTVDCRLRIGLPA